MSDSISVARSSTTTAPRRVLTVLVPLSLLIALFAWAFASPVASSPDDDYHMASIWCGLGVRDGICEPGPSGAERRVPEALLEAKDCFAFQASRSASCPLPPSSQLVATDRGNFKGDYPPLYYGTLSIFAGPNISLSILLMRCFNAFLFVGFATALYALLPRATRKLAVWPAVLSAIPLGVFLIPSVNPSSWALLSAAGLWIALTGFLTAPSRPKRIALGTISGALTVMGAGARSDAAVYAGIAIVVAIILTANRSRAWRLSVILPAVLVIVAIFFFFISGQSGIVDPTKSAAGAGGGKWSLAVLDLTLLPNLWAGVLGTWGLGWLDTPMPPIVWVPALVVFGAVLFAGLRNLDWRKGLSLGLVFGSLVLIPMYILVHDGVVVGAAVQPRYIFPLMIMLIAVALWPSRGRAIHFSAVQFGFIVVALSIANSVALHTNIRRYVTGLDVGGLNLDRNTEWWWNLPLGPDWIWMAGSVSFAGGLVALALLTVRLEARRNGELEVEQKPTLA